MVNHDKMPAIPRTQDPIQDLKAQEKNLTYFLGQLEAAHTQYIENAPADQIYRFLLETEKEFKSAGTISEGDRDKFYEIFAQLELICVDAVESMARKEHGIK